MNLGASQLANLQGSPLVPLPDIAAATQAAAAAASVGAPPTAGGGFGRGLTGQGGMGPLLNPNAYMMNQMGMNLSPLMGLMMAGGGPQLSYQSPDFAMNIGGQGGQNMMGNMMAGQLMGGMGGQGGFAQNVGGPGGGDETHLGTSAAGFEPQVIRSVAVKQVGPSSPLFPGMGQNMNLGQPVAPYGNMGLQGGMGLQQGFAPMF